MMNLTDYGTALYYSTALVAFVTAAVYWGRIWVIRQKLRTGTVPEPEARRALTIACGIVVGFAFIGFNETYFGYLRTFHFAPDYSTSQVLLNGTIKLGTITAGALHIWADRGRDFAFRRLAEAAVLYLAACLVIRVWGV